MKKIKRESIRSKKNSEKKKTTIFRIVAISVVLIFVVVAFIVSYRNQKIVEYEANEDFFASQITEETSEIEQFAGNFIIDLTNGGDLSYTEKEYKDISKENVSIDYYYKELLNVPFYMNNYNRSSVSAAAINVYEAFEAYRNASLDYKVAAESNDYTLYKANVKKTITELSDAYKTYNLLARTRYSISYSFNWE